MDNSNENSGWVKLHRKIMQQPGYFSEAFCRNMAWVDLLLLANHTPNFFRVRGVRIEVNRGQVGFGLETLAQRWKWSRGKVERFLKELEEDKQIVRQKNNVTTLLSIVNYDAYQQDGKANKKTNSKTSYKADGQQTDINKNVKNYNNVEEEATATASFFEKNLKAIQAYFLRGELSKLKGKEITVSQAAVIIYGIEKDSAIKVFNDLAERPYVSKKYTNKWPAFKAFAEYAGCYPDVEKAIVFFNQDGEENKCSLMEFIKREFFAIPRIEYVGTNYRYLPKKQSPKSK